MRPAAGTKKKELLGKYANRGTEWQSAGESERVEVHDIAGRALGEFSTTIPFRDLGHR
jgi:Rhodopirellula transposase DDE domain